MDIRPIHTEADYKATLKEISALMESDPDLGAPVGDRLDILATLVKAYEARHVPITTPDPVEPIKFRMDQNGLSVNLETSVGRGGVCGFLGAWQGATTRNGHSIPRSCNAARRPKNRAIRPVADSPSR